MSYDTEALPAVEREIFELVPSECVDMLPHHPKPRAVTAEQKALDLANIAGSVRPFFRELRFLIQKLLVVFGLQLF